jgi:lycopene beta-cyclase
LTYLGFHLVFILPPLLALWFLQRGRLHEVHPRAGLFLVAIATIALVYTTPWDNYLVRSGVWGYGADRVIGAIGYVPIEEYLFFVLQPLLTGLWLYGLLPSSRTERGRYVRTAGTIAYALLAVAGGFLLARPEGTYLGLILVWAAPVLALQWLYGGREIWARKRALALGVAVPTLYLWAADAVAIHLGIWEISTAHTLGPALGPLPLEEAVFFLVTNLLVVQGLLLLIAPPSGVASRRSPTRERETV